MKTKNRFNSLLKRILYHKVYLLMLLTIIALSAIYRCLPDQKKSTEIKAAICFGETDKYSEALKKELAEANSIYKFEYTGTKDELISLVKASKVECGYYFPVNFFTNYIKGEAASNPTEAYVIPSTTLSATIGETLFANILKITSGDILAYAVNIPELNDALSENLYGYLNGNEIFTLSSSVSGKYNFKEFIYKINIPVYEAALVFIIVSSMLGLLLFERDSEKNMFITMSKRELNSIKLMSITSAVLPVFLVGAISMLITYGASERHVTCVLFTVFSVAFSYITGSIVRKSSDLSKVIPLVTFLSTAIIFLKNLT